MSDKLLKRYVKDRDKALKNLDIGEFIEFLYKYINELGYDFVKAFVSMSETTKMATMCKMVCNIKSFRKTETLQRALSWLKQHDMSKEIKV